LGLGKIRVRVWKFKLDEVSILTMGSAGSESEAGCGGFVFLEVEIYSSLFGDVF